MTPSRAGLQQTCLMSLSSHADRCLLPVLCSGGCAGPGEDKERVGVETPKPFNPLGAAGIRTGRGELRSFLQDALRHQKLSETIVAFHQQVRRAAPAPPPPPTPPISESSLISLKMLSSFGVSFVGELLCRGGSDQRGLEEERAAVQLHHAPGLPGLHQPLHRWGGQVSGQIASGTPSLLFPRAPSQQKCNKR